MKKITVKASREDYTEVNIKKIVRYVIVTKGGRPLGPMMSTGYETIGEAELAREKEEDYRAKRWDKFSKKS